VGNPLYEWIEAAHYDGLSYSEFEKMPVEYKELIIAHMRTQKHIESIVFKESKRKP